MYAYILGKYNFQMWRPILNGHSLAIISKKQISLLLHHQNVNCVVSNMLTKEYVIQGIMTFDYISVLH